MAEQYLTVRVRVDPKWLTDNGEVSPEVGWAEIFKRTDDALKRAFSHEIYYKELEIGADDWFIQPVERRREERRNEVTIAQVN